MEKQYSEIKPEILRSKMSEFGKLVTLKCQVMRFFVYPMTSKLMNNLWFFFLAYTLRNMTIKCVNVHVLRIDSALSLFMLKMFMRKEKENMIPLSLTKI